MIYDSGSVPRRAIFSPRETSPLTFLVLLKSTDVNFWRCRVLPGRGAPGQQSPAGAVPGGEGPYPLFVVKKSFQSHLMVDLELGKAIVDF